MLERLKVKGDESDGWMASPTQGTWVSANSRRYSRTEGPGVLPSMGLQRVGHDLVTEQQLVDARRMLLFIEQRGGFTDA